MGEGRAVGVAGRLGLRGEHLTPEARKGQYDDAYQGPAQSPGDTADEPEQMSRATRGPSAVGRLAASKGSAPTLRSSSVKPATPCGCIKRAWLGNRVVGSGTTSNPAFRIAAAVVVPTVCAVSRHFREPGKARRIWVAASCGVPCKRTEIPGGVCCASRKDSRRLATLPPPTRCTTVSGVISSGRPIGTLDLVVLGEWPLSCPFYRDDPKNTAPVY
jgi:hypothetical protein